MSNEKNFWYDKLLIFLFFVLTAWWGFLQFAKFENYSLHNQLFASVYCILALTGAIFGLWNASKWGGWNSIMGKSLMFFSFGLLGQFFGQLIYSYYIYFLKVAVPYPSLGDIPYFSTIIFYCLGLLYLAKASGATYNLKILKHQMTAGIIPASLLAGAYFLFLKGYEFDFSNPIKVFLDFGYPMGDAIYIGLALIVLLLSKGYLGGIMKKSILFLIIALFVQFLADFYFLYISYYSVYYPGGFNDYIFLVSYFIMNLALIKVYQAHIEISNL